jgi:hypothetical protein
MINDEIMLSINLRTVKTLKTEVMSFSFPMLQLILLDAHGRKMPQTT